MVDGSMRGTTAEQDTRFGNKEAKALKNTKFSKQFETKVDVRKVNVSVLKPWIATTTAKVLGGVEDDILVEFVSEMLEDPATPIPDPRKMQINLTGFMGPTQAAEFMLQLWKLLISAQESVGGIPQEFIEAKKAELLKKQEEEARIQGTMLTNAGRFGGSVANGPGEGQRIHASFPDQRRAGRPSRFDRDGPMPPRNGNNDRDRRQIFGRDQPRDNGYGNRGGIADAPPPPLRRERERDFESNDRYRPARGFDGRDQSPQRPTSPPRRRYIDDDRDRDRRVERGPRDTRDGRDRESNGRDGRVRAPLPSNRDREMNHRSPSPPPRRRQERHSDDTPPRAGRTVPSRTRSPSPSSPPPRRRRKFTSRSPSPAPRPRGRDHRSSSPNPSSPPPSRRRGQSPSSSRSRSRSLSRTRSPSPSAGHRQPQPSASSRIQGRSERGRSNTPEYKAKQHVRSHSRSSSTSSRSRSRTPPTREKKRHLASPSPERSDNRRKKGTAAIEAVADKPVSVKKEKKPESGLLGKSKWNTE